VRIIAVRTLREFWTSHADAEDALRAWYADARKADWKTPADIRSTYANASILSNNRVVFNIRGNTYRLIVTINYGYGMVYVRFIGTHAEYDKVDAETI
jgi:mRNA interferase HigB